MKIKKVNELVLSDNQLEWFRNDKFNKSKKVFYVYEEEIDKDGFPQFRELLDRDSAEGCVEYKKSYENVSKLAR